MPIEPEKSVFELDQFTLLYSHGSGTEELTSL